mgnify:CR=1 FL=1
MSENKLNDIIQTSLDSIRSMVDSNTVLGSPITTANGTLVIPVSKVFVGFASGGVDYLGKNTQSTSHTVNNFGGGGGTGVGYPDGTSRVSDGGAGGSGIVIIRAKG